MCRVELVLDFLSVFQNGIDLVVTRLSAPLTAMLTTVPPTYGGVVKLLFLELCLDVPHEFAHVLRIDSTM